MPTETAAPVRVWTVEAIAATLSKSALRGLRAAWDGKTPRTTDCDALEKANEQWPVWDADHNEPAPLGRAVIVHLDGGDGDLALVMATARAACIKIRQMVFHEVLAHDYEIQPNNRDRTGAVAAGLSDGWTCVTHWTWDRPIALRESERLRVEVRISAKGYVRVSVRNWQDVYHSSGEGKTVATALTAAGIPRKLTAAPRAAAE